MYLIGEEERNVNDIGTTPKEVWPVLFDAFGFGVRSGSSGSKYFDRLSGFGRFDFHFSGVNSWMVCKRDVISPGFCEERGGKQEDNFLSPKAANSRRKTKNLNTFVFRFWWERVDSNHRSQRQQIYSLPPLATRELSHINLGSPAKRMFCWGKDERHNERDLPLAAG